MKQQTETLQRCIEQSVEALERRMDLRLDQLLAEFAKQLEIPEQNRHRENLFAAAPTTVTADLEAAEKRMEERMDRVLAEFKERAITERNHYSKALFAAGALLRKPMVHGAAIVTCVLVFFKSLWLESAALREPLLFCTGMVIVGFVFVSLLSLFCLLFVFIGNRILPWALPEAGAW